LPADIETFKAWRAAGLPESQIYALPAPDNFWKQNALHVGAVNSRKCGPTTEVFYDRGRHLACGPACCPGCSCGRFVELLNTLFITLRMDEANGELLPLEEPFTETVIGRERVTAVLQDFPSVYEIDVLRPLILQTRCSAHAAILPENERRKHERLLVDHLRALLFLTADGAPPPGRGGRARLMRILARELLTSQRLLGISDPGFLRGLLRLALEIYPHLASVQGRTLEYIANESDTFNRTVQRGLRDLEASLFRRVERRLRGEEILALEKRRGIPFSLLKYLCWQKGILYDVNEYHAAHERFQQKALNLETL
jgi:alanyl-tRNA synthetase